MTYQVTVLPAGKKLTVAYGENLLSVLRENGFFVNAICGGSGSCGKCKVWMDGEEVLACRTVIQQDMTVTLSKVESKNILMDGDFQPVTAPCQGGYCLAVDIGTTTVACYLLDGESGQELSRDSALNPQTSYGADVISRIRYALNGHREELTAAIRKCVENLACGLCKNAGVAPDQITQISIVGNPAMQQLFLGISPDNLVKIPFAPVLTQAEKKNAKEYLPAFSDADILIVPDVSGYVGADTLACILATDLYKQEELTLLVDIGTNGEMVLGNRNRMVACSTAAGPALEGAGIVLGMRGQTGAIDHVWLENGKICCSVIGGGEAVGICGSGIIDAVAVALDTGLVNERGRIQNEERRIYLTEQIYLTQEDIRQVQLAKGAIAAGIEMMAAQLGVSLEDIQKVYLAGAFGTFMKAASACRIGMLPAVLESKITVVGNAAGGGAKRLACNRHTLALTQDLVKQIVFIELATVPEFQRCFARNMRFSTAQDYWCQKAINLGFSKAVPVNVDTLQSRQDVRDMCTADKCGAYGKNWTCPPYCGTLAECSAEIHSYTRGILLQTVGTTEKIIDTKAYRRTEGKHLAQFHALSEQIRNIYPHALCLGSGGCRICPKCAFPEKCRFPEKACSSMEGYGLFVTQVCKDNGLAYHYGERTVTYTACILF